MAYRQYTKCVSAANHIGGQYVQVLIGAAVAALPLIFGAGLIPGVLLIAIGAIVAYCRWWLYDRLICLDREVCAIGWLLKIEPPDQKSGLDRFDTDYSINLVLQPHREGATQAQVEADGKQGWLIAEPVETKSHGLSWSGHTVSRWGNSPQTAVLHCEFEGAGVYDLMLAALAALPFAAVGAALCAIPVFGWIACLILSAVATAILVAGVVIGLNDTGNPADVDANLGELHANDPTGRGADILVVQGSWVYDSAHEGWNEIHPIKHCQKIGVWNGSWESSPLTADLPSWCAAVGRAADPLTVTAQGRPENQWTIHPLIDGCAPAGTGEPPPLH